MNKMLISLFTVVSLLSGSSLAQEATTPAAPVPEVPAATDAPAADAATDAPATAAPVAASYYAFDGCSDYKQPKKGQGWKAGDSRPGYYDGTKDLAHIVCCPIDREGNTCSRKNCPSGNAGEEDATGVTLEEAEEHCKKAGMRLCASQAELDTCCGQGCQYDNALVWSSVVKGAEGALADPAAEDSEVVCQVYGDCEGKQWCDTAENPNGECKKRRGGRG